ncbi:MAG: XdhC/CoxI family protein [Firmicutes bacterium]|nr:XdhC/CoxI family protein [Bacillota bacterium]
MVEDIKVLEELNNRLKKNEAVAMVTITDVKGSTPRGIGSVMLVDSSGNLLIGTVGGGILESELKKEAVNCIKRRKSLSVNYKLDDSAVVFNALPMTCGGDISLFIKVFYPREKLIIAGAGHIAEKLSKMAFLLGYAVTVLDNRKERLNKEIFPDIEELIHGNIAKNIKELDVDDNTLIIIVTHGHAFDQDVLEVVLGGKAKYIGMIGSINKIKTCFKNLLEKGFSKEELSKVYTPIGVDLGGESPEEIALSIMAQIQALKYDKEVSHLSNMATKLD